MNNLQVSRQLAGENYSQRSFWHDIESLSFRNCQDSEVYAEYLRSQVVT